MLNGHPLKLSVFIQVNRSGGTLIKIQMMKIGAKRTIVKVVPGFVWSLILIRPPSDSRHHFKMTTVIGAQCQAVADRSAGNEQVPVADGPEVDPDFWTDR